MLGKGFRKKKKKVHVWESETPCCFTEHFEKCSIFLGFGKSHRPQRLVPFSFPKTAKGLNGANEHISSWRFPSPLYVQGRKVFWEAAATQSYLRQTPRSSVKKPWDAAGCPKYFINLINSHGTDSSTLIFVP